MEIVNYARHIVFSCFFVGFCLLSMSAVAQAPLRVGYSISLDKVSPDTMRVSKAAGVECIEVSFSSFIDKQSRQFKISEELILQQVYAAKKAADDAGIDIWSVHMPFSQAIDISLTNEQERRAVIELHKKVLEYCSILKPKIILFHPSWYLGLNERTARKANMIRSATELNTAVKAINATMVIENMLGPELLVNGGQYERPLCRTVEETVEIMDHLPEDIYSAVDMNHIKHPENLIRAMGSRVKHVHIADGDGEAERHYFPCSGKGENDWTAILSALDEIGYKGVFLYESKPETVSGYKTCYEQLYQNYLKTK